MATYISYLRFTEQGIKSIKESPARLDAARGLFKKLGAELKSFYLVTGQFDAIAIAEAPDDTTIAKIMLAIASHGNIRSETTRAFPEEEYRKVIGELP